MQEKLIKAPRVEVLDVRSLPAKCGNLKALVSVQIGPLTVHDFRVIQQNGQRAYVAVPQLEYMGKNGRAFKPMLVCPDSWKDVIGAAVLSAWEAQGGGQ